MRAGSIPEKQAPYPRIKGGFGGNYRYKIIIINDLNFGISWFSWCIERPVETTHALSMPGVMEHLLWAAFPKKIISRKDARPQRERRYFS
jgi:hypothetical protein